MLTSNNYASSLEERFAEQLTSVDEVLRGVYEGCHLAFVVPAKTHKYTPDWFLPNGICIEVKGRLRAEDRTKHQIIRKQYPELDIRFVFQNPNVKIAPTSKTTYGDWCTRMGIPYCSINDTQIIKSWLNEPNNIASMNKILTVGSLKSTAAPEVIHEEEYMEM